MKHLFNTEAILEPSLQKKAIKFVLVNCTMLAYIIKLFFIQKADYFMKGNKLSSSVIKHKCLFPSVSNSHILSKTRKFLTLCVFKITLISTTTLAMFLLGCSKPANSSYPLANGKSNKTSFTLPVQPFKKASFSGSLNVEIVITQKESLHMLVEVERFPFEINADNFAKIYSFEEGYDRIALKSPSEKQRVTFWGCISSDASRKILPNKVKLTLFTPTIEELKLSGSNEIVVNEAAGKRFYCYLAGASNLFINNMKSEKIKFNGSGANTITAHNINTKTLYLNCSGANNICLSGTADVAELKTSGVSNIDFSQFKAKKMYTSFSGLSKIK